MKIGRDAIYSDTGEISSFLAQCKQEEPEWYEALRNYNTSQLRRIISLCKQDDPRVIARTLRAEGYIRPAELTEEAMKKYPIYKDYFIH